MTTVAQSTNANGTQSELYVNIAIHNRTEPLLNAEMEFDFDASDTANPGSGISATMRQPGFSATCLESSAALTGPHPLCRSFQAAVRDSLCESANVVLLGVGLPTLGNCGYVVILGIVLRRLGQVVLRALLEVEVTGLHGSDSLFEDSSLGELGVDWSSRREFGSAREAVRRGLMLEGNKKPHAVLVREVVRRLQEKPRRKSALSGHLLGRGDVGKYIIFKLSPAAELFNSCLQRMLSHDLYTRTFRIVR